MQAENHKSLLFWMIGVGSVMNFALGWLLSHPLPVGGGAIGLGYVLLRLATGKRRRPMYAADPPPEVVRPAVKRSPEPADPNDTDGLIERMLTQGRYALLLRPQIGGNLDDAQFRRALEALEQGMALVPDGEVVLGQIDEALEDGKLEEEEIIDHECRVVRVERFFIDRFPVTNREFSEFVAAGGYEQVALWDESIWMAVLDFVDRTGEPGPRDWRGGCFEPGKEKYPVVGVNWFEAAAYARWLGKRLPSDAEWVKAGSWPVSLTSTTRMQRRYPWGEAMDRARANLWGSGPEGSVPVDQFPEGVSVGGVYQLIGNVWEWTRGEFCDPIFPADELVLEIPLKSIRGGAFDTYFDNQATCQFQSGEVAMARKHNIGFRCAVGVCDLMLSRTVKGPVPAREVEVAAIEEEIGV